MSDLIQLISTESQNVNYVNRVCNNYHVILLLNYFEYFQISYYKLLSLFNIGTILNNIKMYAVLRRYKINIPKCRCMYFL